MKDYLGILERVMWLVRIDWLGFRLERMDVGRRARNLFGVVMYMETRNFYDTDR